MCVGWAAWMTGSVDDMGAVEDFLPYWGRWELTEARRYFARSPVPLSVSLLSDRADGDLHWREVSFAAGAGVKGIATVVSPVLETVTRGVVLAHGGSDDGRQFFMAEAAALAAEGAAVILPVARIRQNDGVDAFAADVRNAVLTERAALDVLVEAGAPPDALSFLGHSGGGALGESCALWNLDWPGSRSSVTAPAHWSGRSRLSDFRVAAASRRIWPPLRIGSISLTSSVSTGAHSCWFSMVAPIKACRSRRVGRCTTRPHRRSCGPDTTGTTGWTPTLKPGRTAPNSSRPARKLRCRGRLRIDLPHLQA